MSKRKALTQRARFEVFKRDGFTCQYCGSTPPAVTLEVDHIVAVSNGGDNDQDNLVTSCFNCNRGKSDVPLDAIPETLKEKAARVKEAEAQVQAYYQTLQSRKDRVDRESWEIAEILSPGCGKSGFSIAYRKSIVNFLSRLDFYEVEDAASTAFCRLEDEDEMFRCFCGICWRKIKENG